MAEKDSEKVTSITPDLLDRPLWVRLQCEWLRGGLRKYRHVMSGKDELERHLRLVEIANEATYLMRDHRLGGRAEHHGGAEGGALMLLLLDGMLGEVTDGQVKLDALLHALSRRIDGGSSHPSDQTDAFLAALAEVTPAASVHDFAYGVLDDGFPLPMDFFLAKHLARMGWWVEHVPYETVTQAQAYRDDPRERGGPENLMNHLGRLVGWADAYPSWNFTVDGWEPIRFNGIPEAEVFKETYTLIEIEGYPLPVGAGPAYAEARRRVLAGEGFKVRVAEGSQEFTVKTKIFPPRRAQVYPEGFLRVVYEA